MYKGQGGDLVFIHKSFVAVCSAKVTSPSGIVQLDLHDLSGRTGYGRERARARIG